ncbi:hypothetical protein BYT27DRAFT_7095566, partial [Phlegmacium glaucopus]
KRAIGSFFEWDWLDQAVGGRSNPLVQFFYFNPFPFGPYQILPTGTKLHTKGHLQTTTGNHEVNSQVLRKT